MDKRIFGTGLMAAMTGILCLFSSCGGDSALNPLDAVPPGSRQISVLDLETIAKSAGAPALTTSDGLTPEAEESIGMFLPSDLMRPLAAILYSENPPVETKGIVLFTAANGYSGLILGVTDRQRLTGGTLNSFRESKLDTGDFDMYSIGKRYVGVSDRLCIIAPDVATIQSISKHKSSAPISEMAGVKEFLSSDYAIKSARIASDLFGKKMAGLWLCGAIRFSENSVIADICALHPDGKPDEIGARIASEIDTDVLRFIPGNSSLVIASGLQGEDAKLFGLEDLMQRYFPGDPIMSKTGTTVWYARPAGSLSPDTYLSPSLWNFAGLIQMPQADGDAAIKKMQNMTGGTGRLDPETGLYTLTNGDSSMTYGYVDEFFVESVNGPMSINDSNPFTQDFTGARLAAIIDIPLGSSLQTATSLPCGASLAVKVSTENIHAKLSFYGNRTPVLSTLDAIPVTHNLLPFLLGLK